MANEINDVVHTVHQENLPSTSSSDNDQRAKSPECDKFSAVDITKYLSLTEVKKEPIDFCESNMQIYGEELSAEEQMKLFSFNPNDHMEDFERAEQSASAEESDIILNKMRSVVNTGVQNINRGRKKLVMVRKLKRQIKENPKPLCLPKRTQQYTCNDCGKQFISQYYLSLHQAREKSAACTSNSLSDCITCKLCLKSFQILPNLLDHIVKAHKSVGVCFDLNEYILKPHPEESAASKHVCLHCKSTFVDLKIFNDHLKVHTSNNECVACSLSFQNKTELLEHRKEHFNKSVLPKEYAKEKASPEETPTHKLEDRLRCDRCPASFPRTAINLWTKHGRSHVKKFQCDICGKMFVKQIELIHHKSQDIGCQYKMHRCTMCTRQFATLDELSVHAQEHRNQCSICKITFLSEEQRKSHVHKLVGLYKCDLCEVSLSTPLAVKHHKRMAHNNDYVVGKSKHL